METHNEAYTNFTKELMAVSHAFIAARMNIEDLLTLSLNTLIEGSRCKTNTGKQDSECKSIFRPVVELAVDLTTSKVVESNRSIGACRTLSEAE